MIACDNEGDCPYEWVRFCSTQSERLKTDSSTVPSQLRRYQRPNARAVVLRPLQGQVGREGGVEEGKEEVRGSERRLSVNLKVHLSEMPSRRLGSRVDVYR